MATKNTQGRASAWPFMSTATRDIGHEAAALHLSAGMRSMCSSSPTGRLNQQDPDIQNFPGTLAASFERIFARLGARAFK